MPECECRRWRERGGEGDGKEFVSSDYEYKDRVGEICNGIVKRVEGGNIIVDMAWVETYGADKVAVVKKYEELERGFLEWWKVGRCF